MATHMGRGACLRCMFRANVLHILQTRSMSDRKQLRAQGALERTPKQGHTMGWGTSIRSSRSSSTRTAQCSSFP